MAEFLGEGDFGGRRVWIQIVGPIRWFESNRPRGIVD